MGKGRQKWGQKVVARKKSSSRQVGKVVSREGEVVQLGRHKVSLSVPILQCLSVHLVQPVSHCRPAASHACCLSCPLSCHHLHAVQSCPVCPKTYRHCHYA